MTKSADHDSSIGFPSERDRLEDEAAEWFARLSGDQVSEGDYAAYRAWRDASAEHAYAYDRIAAIWDVAGEHADAPSILEMRVRALAEQPEASTSLRRYPMIALAASIAVVFIASAIMLTGGSPFSVTPSVSPGPTIAANEAGAPAQDAPSQPSAPISDTPETVDFRSGYSTKVGQMAQFTLPDGSVIELNTGSEVQVNYSAAERNLTLVRGEAVFTVSKDAQRPFIVAAGQNRVVALGTVFSVRKRDSEAQVTLIEGRVRVDRDGTVGSGKSTQLTPGEQLSILPDRPFAISKTELSQIASWREGRLVFEQTPLREVLDEFNRYSNEKHVLRDEELGSFLVSGTFRIKSSEHFAATLEAGFPVLVRARAGGTVLEVTSAQDSGS
ncbi:FecR domain-containing protein [Erythrobacter sp. F6033]|uniref:FecR family protein n=1 Tax=Erythrobacter sp. F6033 TaxID=2926401 RepID=UPI001FF5C93E|nr:FecR domain-containing protein [Erythrobacter sp. F6033]MCK0127556.1 FecR domain-containing protein [Erythrobacter sp. F6033]